MGILVENGVKSVYHYAPLHYLPFIARANALLTKISIRRDSFPQEHFRSKSNQQDVARGFGSYAFLTLDPYPPILQAKLMAGFPHLRINVPAQCIDSVPFSLCRFNVAMTRYLRRLGKPGYPESPSNGRYYDAHQIPVARTEEDKRALLRTHLGQSMIEVLSHGDLSLPKETSLTCFCQDDADLVQETVAHLRMPWIINVMAPRGAYVRKAAHVASVVTFIDRALTNPAWRGNGLEFDRV